MYLEYPNIHGTADEKIEQISGYLYKLAEISNYNLEQSTPEGIFRQAAEAVSSAESEAVTKDKRAQFRGLRDLIIKSAGSVMISEQEISHSLAGLFVAESDFGTFKKETEQTFTANSESFKSLFKKDEEISTDITNYKSEMQNYIFAGYDGDVFALDIGLLKNKYTEGEKEVSNDTPKKFRITPTRASLFSGSNEVAYLSENAVYFPNAHITGGTLDIGGGTFKVTSDGALTASSGTIAGWKIGTGAPGLPSGSTAIFNTVEGTDEKFSVGMQASGSTVNVNFFVKKYNTLKSEWEDVFYVKNNGKLKAIDAEIEGTITSSTIKSSTIEVGTYGKGSSGFKVDSSGNLYASNATIYGTLKATSIDNGTYGKDKTGFSLTTGGALSASGASIYGTIYASAGQIGGLTLAAQKLYALNTDNTTKVLLASTGQSITGYQYITENGQTTKKAVTLSNVYFKAGDVFIQNNALTVPTISAGTIMAGTIAGNIPGYATVNHTHSGYASSTHNHDSSYAAKSHTHDTLQASGNTLKLAVTYNGNEVDGITILPATANNKTQIYTRINTLANCTTTSAGNVFANEYGSLWRSTSSSRRYKTDISELKSDWLNPHGLYNIPVVEYVYKKGYLSSEDLNCGKKVIGLIAEDVEKYYPIGATYNEDGTVENWNERFVIPGMLKLIQEQHEQITKLQAQVSALIAKSA